MIKKSLAILGIIGMLSFTTFEEKKLKVELPIKEWEKGIGAIELAKNAIKQSDLPAKVALVIVDSLSVFEGKLIEQLNKQIDTTSKK